MFINGNGGLTKGITTVGVSFSLFCASLQGEAKLCRYLNPNECDNEHEIHVENAIALGVPELDYKEIALTNVVTLNPSGTQANRHDWVKKIYIDSQEKDIDREIVIINLNHRL